MNSAIPVRVRSPVPRLGLSPPFAVIGFAGSAIVADLIFGSFLDAPPLHLLEWLTFSLAVVGSVTTACALLGRVARRAGHAHVILAGCGLAVLGALFGALAGALSAGISAVFELIFRPASAPGFLIVPGGALLGALLSPAFWPSLAAVFFVWRRTGKARRGSLLAGSEAESLLVATTCSVALSATIVAHLSTPPHAAREVFVAAVATAALGALTVAELGRLRRMTSLVRGLERVVEPHRVCADAELDLGMGDERWMSAATPDAPYRGSRRSERCVRGALHDVRERLTKTVLIDGWLFGLCLVFLVLEVAALRAAPPARLVSWRPDGLLGGL